MVPSALHATPELLLSKCFPSKLPLPAKKRRSKDKRLAVQTSLSDLQQKGTYSASPLQDLLTAPCWGRGLPAQTTQLQQARPAKGRCGIECWSAVNKIKPHTVLDLKTQAHHFTEILQLSVFGPKKISPKNIPNSMKNETMGIIKAAHVIQINPCVQLQVFPTSISLRCLSFRFLFFPHMGSDTEVQEWVRKRRERKKNQAQLHICA